MTNAEMYHTENLAHVENEWRKFEDRKRRLAFYDVQLTLAANEAVAVKPATVESPKGYRIVLDPPANPSWLAAQGDWDAFVKGQVS